MLARTESNLKKVRPAELERLRLAREWALAHVITDPDLLGDPRRRPTPLGAVGLPVDEYAAAEFAAALELHPLAGRRVMADAVDIEQRLPRLWSALAAGRVEVWVARKVAAATADLSSGAAAWVDEALADLLGTLPSGRLLRLVESRVIEADQALADRKAEEARASHGVWLGREEAHGIRILVVRASGEGVRRLNGTIDHLAHLLGQHGGEAERAATLDALRAEAAALLANPLAVLKLLVGAGEADCPQVVADAIRTSRASKVRPVAVAYLHLDPRLLLGRGVARAEELGALTRQRPVDLLGHHQVSLRPVIDLNEGMAADCYEVPAAIDERLQLSKLADVLPFACSMSRKLDRDHTEAFDDGGPPGQTAEPNLGKLTRHHHRIKTHGGWQVSQHGGRFTWISPHARVYRTDGRGTRRSTQRRGACYIDLVWSPAA